MDFEQEQLTKSQWALYSNDLKNNGINRGNTKDQTI